MKSNESYSVGTLIVATIIMCFIVYLFTFVVAWGVFTIFPFLPMNYGAMQTILVFLMILFKLGGDRQ